MKYVQDPLCYVKINRWSEQACAIYAQYLMACCLRVNLDAATAMKKDNWEQHNTTRKRVIAGDMRERGSTADDEVGPVTLRVLVRLAKQVANAFGNTQYAVSAYATWSRQHVVDPSILCRVGRVGSPRSKCTVWPSHCFHRAELILRMTQNDETAQINDPRVSLQPMTLPFYCRLISDTI